MFTTYTKINMIEGIFLLFLAVSGNFLAETLPCKIQKLFSNNMIAKWVLIFFLIYFTINFTSKNSTKEEKNPIHILGKSLIIWFGFLLLSNTTPVFTILCLSSIIIMYILDNYNNYYDDEDTIKIVEKVQHILIWLTIIFLIIGFILYFIKQKKDHKKKFNYIKFLFGVNKCNSLK